MVFPKDAFLTATPESQGVRSGDIRAALEAIRAAGKDIHSMLVLKNGYLISETYFSPYNEHMPHAMYSCSKTFTSMLIGIAQGKGLLSVEDRVASFFPDKLPEDSSDNLLAMRIRDLLSMSAGNDQDTYPAMTSSTEDWVKIFLSRPVEHEPGTFFRYNTGATYMLSAILTKVTGKTALQLANEWLFAPIGLGRARWESSPQGISLGGTGLHLTPRQMARFGLLLLNEGQWDGEEVVPRGYVLEAQKKHIGTENHIQHPAWCAGYCWQMWRCDFDAFRADGMGGQFITVLPDASAVVVFTSALGADIVYPMDVVREYLAPALRASADSIPENVEEQAALTACSESLAHPVKGPVPAAAETAVPWGKRIHLQEKLLGLASSFTLERDCMLVQTDYGSGRLGFGWGAPVLSYDEVTYMRRFILRPSLMASFGDCFTLRMNAYGQPFTVWFDMRFSQGKVEIAQRATMLLEQKTIVGTYE